MRINFLRASNNEHYWTPINYLNALHQQETQE